MKLLTTVLTFALFGLAAADDLSNAIPSVVISDPTPDPPAAKGAADKDEGLSR